MDADLIRLILLVVGASLVAGIWLWDRRQRGDEHSMARREPEHPQEQEPEEEAGPEPDVSLYVEPEPPPDEAEGARPAVSTASPAEPASVPLPHRPAWLEPAEPVIPAFLLNADCESRFDHDEPVNASSAEAPEALPDSAAADADPEPAWLPDANPAFALPTAEHARPDVGQVPESLAADLEEEPSLPVLELEAEPIDAQGRSRKKKTASTEPHEPVSKAEAEPVSIRMEEDQFDLDLGFSAVDDHDLQEAAADLPELIVQINVVAKRGQPFSGEQILAAMDQVEMKAGEFDIFHRYDNRVRDKQGRHKVLFSLASLVEPGNFPLKKMKDFSTPGLTLFAQLPGPRDGLLVYSDMLYVAERLVRLLDARLKDENRSTLTKQTIEHTRGRIAEHKRQITLKLRESTQNTRGRR